MKLPLITEHPGVSGGKHAREGERRWRAGRDERVRRGSQSELGSNGFTLSAHLRLVILIKKGLVYLCYHLCLENGQPRAGKVKEERIRW
ncbi:hypothetical protein E2C01_071887 [Portunus trituberculatus]|uniref:Uncharacterized protein n=1 Tax=Portunus trituberculatus TaxID=210409 RepID=A0A5B7I9M6_PORTR|nr:hypothetical protein [Portunus trituberculatus]